MTTCMYIVRRIGWDRMDRLDWIRLDYIDIDIDIDKDYIDIDYIDIDIDIDRYCI